MDRWLTVREAVPVLRMSEQTIYRVVREHQLPDSAVLRIGRRIRIDPTALRQAINDASNNGADESEAARCQMKRAG